jgi:peptidoglycan lytic transglycosylase
MPQFRTITKPRKEEHSKIEPNFVVSVFRAFVMKKSLAVLVLAVLLTGCGAGAPPPVPPGAPRPYQIQGKWYRPMARADNFTQRGKASWYGKKFHGRKTANGEVYNMYGLSAAHKTLPLGTWVRVKNLDNGTRLDVRINDRGPFVAGRVIDLSYGAAKKLGVVGPGTARVHLTALGKPSGTGGKAAARTYTPVNFDRGNFTIQVGAFKSRQNAERLKKELDRKFRNAHVTAYAHEAHGTLYGVRLGQTTSYQQAQQFKQRLRDNGHTGAFTVAE